VGVVVMTGGSPSLRRSRPMVTVTVLVNGSAPGTIWLLAAAMVLTVGVSTGAAAATRCPAGAGCPVDVTKLSLTGVQAGQALVAIGPRAGLGVLAAWAAGALLAGGILLCLRDT
jgi:hypothetical protein